MKSACNAYSVTTHSTFDVHVKRVFLLVDVKTIFLLKQTLTSKANRQQNYVLIERASFNRFLLFKVKNKTTKKRFNSRSWFVDFEAELFV